MTGASWQIGHAAGDPPSVEVQILQSALTRLGLYRGPIHGRYDPATAAAVVDFRRGCAFGDDFEIADPVLVGAIRGAADALRKE